MSFNVRPWSREQHTFWLSKPFGLDINSWFEVRVCTFVTVEVLPEQCNDSAVSQALLLPCCGCAWLVEVEVSLSHNDSSVCCHVLLLFVLSFFNLTERALPPPCCGCAWYVEVPYIN